MPVFGGHGIEDRERAAARYRDDLVLLAVLEARSGGGRARSFAPHDDRAPSLARWDVPARRVAA